MRVTDALALKIDTNGHTGDTTDASTYVVTLSTGGMRLLCESELPEDKDVRVSIKLASQPNPVEIRAHVASCTECTPGSGKYSTRMLFKQIDDATQSLLEQHINHVVEQTSVIRELPYKKIA